MTATQPADYNFNAGKVTFNAGETSKPITVAVNGDVAIEGDETFRVNLSAATNATIAIAASTIITRRRQREVFDTSIAAKTP